jgi:hypothetical protein
VRGAADPWRSFQTRCAIKRSSTRYQHVLIQCGRAQLDSSHHMQPVNRQHCHARHPLCRLGPIRCIVRTDWHWKPPFKVNTCRPSLCCSAPFYNLLLNFKPTGGVRNLCNTNTCTTTYVFVLTFTYGTRGDAVGWGTALQAGRSRVRFPMVSLRLFTDTILPTALSMALGSTQRLTEMSTRNISWRVKAAGTYGWQPYQLNVPDTISNKQKTGTGVVK